MSTGVFLLIGKLQGCSLPPMILDRWKVCQKIVYGIPSAPLKPIARNDSMTRGVCLRIMQMGGDTPNDVESEVELMTNHIYGMNQYWMVESDEINSINRFEELRFGPIQIPVLVVVRMKSCGNERRPPKSSTRFRNTRKIISDRKIRANLCQCGQCGTVDHNKRSCDSRNTTLMVNSSR